ncbi:MAG: glycosyltransferase [Anaerolineae bacterium]|nr:glycosyltransferase [Anaerolineae bacterium]
MQCKQYPNKQPLLSIVTPAYNEADNLPLLYEQLIQSLNSLDLAWEWIVVDDHSSDETFAVIEQIAGQNVQVQGIRFARNFGSHTAITCGLHQAKGDCAVVMAADMQDPPQILPEFVEQWRAGAQVVWAVRARREGEKASRVGFARLYYLLMRRFVGLNQMPATGADFFLVDRRVLDAFVQFNERNVSIMALITWMGFRQAVVTYSKRTRMHGQSGWSLEKKLKLVVDSVTSFTHLPIRLMSYVGFVTALLGFFYAGIVTFNALRGLPPQGWASLMIVVLILGGIQMVMLGVLGEYLWRALDETRSRPRYLIEATTRRGEQR